MTAIELYNDIFGPVILGLIPAVIYVIALFFKGGYKAILVTCAIAVIECIYTIPDKPGMIFFNIIMSIVFLLVWFSNYKANHKGDIAGIYRDLFDDDLDNDGIKDDFQRFSWARSKWVTWFTASKKSKKINKEPTADEFARFANYAGADAYKSFRSEAGRREYAERNNSRRGDYYNSGNRDYGNTSWDYKDEKNYSENQENNNLRARAKMHNLSYFAKCKDIKEARTLYHKYAAKFHPDNAVTGNKEKFIAIDQEYNRFCELMEKGAN